MAILNKKFIDELNGKVGPFVFKNYNGRTVVSSLPSKYNISKNPAAVNGRSKFKVASKFSKSVKSLPVLNSIWNTLSKTNNNTYVTIFKYNFNKTGIDRPTINNIITPGGFSLPVLSAYTDTEKVTVKISSLNKVYPVSPSEVILSGNMLVCFIDPIKPKDELFEIIISSKEFSNVDLTRDNELQIDFDASQKLITSKYSNSILYFSIATKSTVGKIIMYSSSYAKESKVE